MSELRVNIMDAKRGICGEMHGSYINALVASLAAEPETIADLELALKRFVKFDDDWTPLKDFRSGENLEPWDAGILAVDLKARLIACDSTYSHAQKTGTVDVDCGFADDAKDGDRFALPYRIADDWKILDDVLSFEGMALSRRKEREKEPPFDARPVLYGRSLRQFLVKEMLAADDIEDERLFSDIHAGWMTTPNEALRGKTPREIFLEKEDFLGSDLQYRLRQYSVTKICPEPLLVSSSAYLNAGFGRHEIIMHYDMVRELLSSCYSELKSGAQVDLESEIARLKKVGEEWLRTANPETSGLTPLQIIEMERRRLNLTMGPHQALISDDCPLCVAMSEDFDTPMFWFFDGSHMDNRFEFSFHKSLEEYEKEQKKWDEIGKMSRA